NMLTFQQLQFTILLLVITLNIMFNFCFAFTIFYHFTHLQTEFHIRGNCFSLSGSTTGGCCPVGWTVFESNCYFFSSDSQSWTGSRDWCETQQAHLVILRNDKEWDFVTRNTIPQLYWIGLSDSRTGRWEWVNQTPYRIERRRWGPGQPDSWTGHGLGGDEDCAHLHSDGRLNDHHCSARFRFICQKHSLNI
uniref:C-type lectin domain-containing protein n=1 Tax=Astatotilapia calliptera TaxID=8154 RepID=A0AAX7U3I8_ASTCA